MDWSRWSVVLLKPDCLRRGLTDRVLARLEPAAQIVHRRRVVVADWQIHVHYWDLLVDRDLFEVDVPACLRSTYVGQQVEVALAHGEPGTPERLRDLLGHFDPTQAAPGTVRADLGTDSLTAARAQQRLVENLIHTSDHARAARRDFGTWFGADQHQLLDIKEDHR
ncbi:nucleoside-diphosphate kinase [Kitasatospora sp. RB6PN24]|uniref:nucleoside-diphosphate kinase n=1 Tax=Kitasatospora humi TaxID=2893891 RepID=UPI001E2F34F6|nr:nucleoside-diphosphate kinase [Kitasatospora humi]MCC9307310.1 nucleoside-diphosphate kinase [Kitasatospora humi]